MKNCWKVRNWFGKKIDNLKISENEIENFKKVKEKKKNLENIKNENDLI